MLDLNLFTIQFTLAAALLALIYAFLLTRHLLAHPESKGEMLKFSTAIKIGANTYIKRQTLIITLVSLFTSLPLMYIFGPTLAFGFLTAAAASATAGFLGTHVAIRCNNRTAQAAHQSTDAALSIAFKGGAVTGLLVVGLSLLVVTFYYFVTGDLKALLGLGLGTSLVSVFARIGGGIYTKGADIGADNGGKIKQNLPEDDFRNPGVIADNVGDNVGDGAGMATDLFETHALSLVATMLLGNLLFPHFKLAVTYPLALGATAIIATILGTFFVRMGRARSVVGALYKGVAASAVLSLFGFYVVTHYLMAENGLYTWVNLFYCTMVGVLVLLALLVITEYYTSKKYSPVRNLAKASSTGISPLIVSGIALSLKATFLPILAIVTGIVFAHNFAGLYGIAIAAVSLLSLTGIIVALDTFGPIADNAGGLAQMAKLPNNVISITEILDTVGNTTKAVAKTYAIGSTGLATFLLFTVFANEIKQGLSTLEFSLNNPQVVIGLIIGAALPYYFAALNLEAVGKTAAAVTREIQRQFESIKSLLGGTTEPEYSRAIDVATKSALGHMIIPALIPVFVPIFVGLKLGPLSLGGLVLGSIISGLFLALSMTISGAAWDNAKKFVGEGNFGGIGSKAHTAATIGDLVGDPLKDSAGPAINPMIKVISLIALLLVPFLV